MSPLRRATYSVIMFSAFGLLGVILARHDLLHAWPFILFYILVLANDFLSIKYFSKIISPKRLSQIIIDTILVLLHFASVFFFDNPQGFVIIMTIFFIVATLKYAWDLPAVSDGRTLYRKIKIDTLGACISAAALGGIFWGYPLTAVALWTGIFITASIYVIGINPLYQDPKDHT